MLSFLHLIFNPDGRIKRLQFIGGYFGVMLLVMLLYLIPLLISVFIYSSSETFYSVSSQQGIASSMGVMHTNLLFDSWVALLFFLPATFILLYCKICLDVKRFRDIGVSPWWVLLFLLPWVNMLIMLYLMLMPSSED